jgi:hypothetical protein
MADLDRAFEQANAAVAAVNGNGAHPPAKTAADLDADDFDSYISQTAAGAVEAATVEAADAAAFVSAVTVDDADFWDSRKGLTLVRGWARARRAGPYATLADVLAGVLCRVPPAVQLPALIGGRGSLNMLFASVGPSSDGKGASVNACKEGVDWSGAHCPIVPAVPLSTGEGLERTFGIGKRSKEGTYEMERTCWRAMFTVREIDRMAAVMARKGTILSSTLRQVYSGEELGSGNASAELRVLIPAHEYRACVSVGVQPKRGEVLLAEEDGGLPQRFLWMPTSDPGVPDRKPDDPGRIVWRPADEIVIMPEYHPDPLVMGLWSGVADAIDRARVARMRGQGGALDGHSLFTREKTSAALALFDGHAEVTEEDWQLAGFLMSVSDRTRDYIASTLSAEVRARNEAAGYADAARAEIVENAAEARKIRKTCDRIRTKLTDKPVEWSHSDLRAQIDPAYRDYFLIALDRLAGSGQIVRRGVEYHGSTGWRYRLAGLDEG